MVLALTALLWDVVEFSPAAAFPTHPQLIRLSSQVKT